MDAHGSVVVKVGRQQNSGVFDEHRTPLFTRRARVYTYISARTAAQMLHPPPPGLARVALLRFRARALERVMLRIARFTTYGVRATSVLHW